jgi:hypothetical protein
MSPTEELLGRKSSGFGLESREYGCRDPWPRGTLYPQKLALTSPTSGGCLVGIVCSWTLATEFSCMIWNCAALNLSDFNIICLIVEKVCRAKPMIIICVIKRIVGPGRTRCMFVSYYFVITSRVCKKICANSYVNTRYKVFKKNLGPYFQWVH